MDTGGSENLLESYFKCSNCVFTGVFLAQSV